MSMPSGRDPIDRLRAADPSHTDDVPDASLARVSARTQEHIMSDLRRDPSRLPPTRGPLAVIGGLAVVGAVALAIAFGSGFATPAPSAGPVAVVPTVSPEPSSDPSTDPIAGGGAAGGGAASCIRYDPSILPSYDVVFDGTVTAIDGDQVTFDVNTGWKGAKGSITLTAPESNIAITGPAPEFKVGGRYLVSAAETTINTCGYTLDYDAATAATWAAAFGS
ncbi:MAG TPA: hypothetical protein VM408_00485 [Methylomirabilota bacterium]|nr:hypothetical protein [Methylomirabilota bacterium]